MAFFLSFTWNDGMLEQWNNGVMDFKGNKRVFLLFPNVPLFQL